MKHFGEIALNIADYKPAKWLSYIDDTFVVWPHDQLGFSSFFTISTMLDLPSNSQWKLKLMIPFLSWKFWLLSVVQN
jgi:hypothetical protein